MDGRVVIWNRIAKKTGVATIRNAGFGFLCAMPWPQAIRTLQRGESVEHPTFRDYRLATVRDLVADSLAGVLVTLALGASAG